MISEVFAAEASKITNPALSENIRNLAGGVFLGNFIRMAITLFLIAGVIVALFMLLWGGIRWMTAGGDKASTEASRDRITHAFIGLLILFSAWAVILLIEKFLGITILGGPIKLPEIVPTP